MNPLPCCLWITNFCIFFLRPLAFPFADLKTLLKQGLLLLYAYKSPLITYPQNLWIILCTEPETPYRISVCGGHPTVLLYGFLISAKDLALPGAGEFLGTQQTGYRPFKIANLQRDKILLPLLPFFAKHFLEDKPEVVPAITRRSLSDFEQFLQG